MQTKEFEIIFLPSYTWNNFKPRATVHTAAKWLKLGRVTFWLFEILTG